MKTYRNSADLFRISIVCGLLMFAFQNCGKFSATSTSDGSVQLSSTAAPQPTTDPAVVPSSGEADKVISTRTFDYGIDSAASTLRLLGTEKLMQSGIVTYEMNVKDVAVNGTSSGSTLTLVELENYRKTLSITIETGPIVDASLISSDGTVSDSDCKLVSSTQRPMQASALQSWELVCSVKNGTSRINLKMFKFVKAMDETVDFEAIALAMQWDPTRVASTPLFQWGSL